MRRTIEAFAEVSDASYSADPVGEFKLFCTCGLIPLYESGILRMFWRG